MQNFTTGIATITIRNPERGQPMWKVFVTGWNEDDESVEGEGFCDNEDSALEDACGRWGISEIGEVSESRFVPDSSREWWPAALYMRNGTRRGNHA